LSDDQVLVPYAAWQAALLEFGLLEFVPLDFGAPSFAATRGSECAS